MLLKKREGALREAGESHRQGLFDWAGAALLGLCQALGSQLQEGGWREGREEEGRGGCEEAEAELTHGCVNKDDRIVQARYRSALAVPSPSRVFRAPIPSSPGAGNAPLGAPLGGWKAGGGPCGGRGPPLTSAICQASCGASLGVQCEDGKERLNAESLRGATASAACNATGLEVRIDTMWE